VRLWVGVAVVGIGALIIGGAFASRTWNYVKHDDEFCTSCHATEETFGRFKESEHSKLNCRECHEQSTSASLRQVRWVVTRPENVGPHAAVPPGVCAECHVTEDPDSTWQRISVTIGHRVHLEADTSALTGVVCVTCHGTELHRFVPADSTCGQSACHDPSKTEVVLGDMAGQTGFHCVTCHEFTAPAPEQAPIEAVRTAFVPALAQCQSCHEMENVLKGLDPRLDPHNAVCGTCHNPHTQEEPAEASGRCAECHAPTDELTPFHRGLRREVAEDCVGCHSPHTFRVEGEDCVACHADIVGGTPTAGPKARTSEREQVERTGRRDANVAAAERRSFVRTVTLDLAAEGDGVDGTSAVMREIVRGMLQQEAFDHLEHREVTCTLCHTSQRTHGEVTLESGRTQCMECHHRSVTSASGCTRCHSAAEVSAPRTVEVGMTVRGRTFARRIAFPHGRHAGVGCAQCHTQGVSMRVERTCADCHQNHHTATASCVTCHNQPNRPSHTSVVHTRSCAGSSCHESASYGAMAQGRNTCLVCHQDRTDHRPGQVCAGCHRVTFSSLDFSPGEAVAR
jgi:hypothetical protein